MQAKPVTPKQIPEVQEPIEVDQPNTSESSEEGTIALSGSTENLTWS